VINNVNLVNRNEVLAMLGMNITGNHEYYCCW